MQWRDTLQGIEKRSGPPTVQSIEKRSGPPTVQSIEKRSEPPTLKNIEKSSEPPIVQSTEIKHRVWIKSLFFCYSVHQIWKFIDKFLKKAQIFKSPWDPYYNLVLNRVFINHFQSLQTFYNTSFFLFLFLQGNHVYKNCIAQNVKNFQSTIYYQTTNIY